MFDRQSNEAEIELGTCMSDRLGIVPIAELADRLDSPLKSTVELQLAITSSSRSRLMIDQAMGMPEIWWAVMLSEWNRGDDRRIRIY